MEHLPCTKIWYTHGESYQLSWKVKSLADSKIVPSGVKNSEIYLEIPRAWCQKNVTSTVTVNRYVILQCDALSLHEMSRQGQIENVTLHPYSLK